MHEGHFAFVGGGWPVEGAGKKPPRLVAMRRAVLGWDGTGWVATTDSDVTARSERLDPLPLLLSHAVLDASGEGVGVGDWALVVEYPHAPAKGDRTMYEVVAEWDSGTWALTVPAVKGCHSQARDLDEIEVMARDVIALLLGVPERSFGLRATVTARNDRHRQRRETLRAVLEDFEHESGPFTEGELADARQRLGIGQGGSPGTD